MTGVHPDLIERLTRLHNAMEDLGKPMRATDGLRTTEQQQALYAQGRTTSGNIVTNADGVTHKSNHQPHDDGFGHAVDSCFIGSDPYLEHDPHGSLWWNAFGACARALGLTWGGDFKSLVDRPHVELPNLPPSKGPTVLNA